MLERMGIVRTDCGREAMLSCLRAYFYLREQRNQVNHATTENIMQRGAIEGLLNNVLAALDAGTSDVQREER